VLVLGHVHLPGGPFVPPRERLDTGLREMATEGTEITPPPQ
jgi:hypothetical protein